MSNPIREWRDRCGITQELAARRLGITLRNYQAYEAGDYDPPESVRRLMTVIEGGGDPQPLPLVKPAARPVHKRKAKAK